MYFAVGYCAVRNGLEEQALNLNAELVGLTNRLHHLVGKDYQEFLDTRISCTKVRQQISESHNRLEAHRTAHGC